VQLTPSQKSSEREKREGGGDMDVEKVTEVAPEVDDDGRVRTGITHATHSLGLSPSRVCFSQLEFVDSFG
jgi:hypothetical protein